MTIDADKNSALCQMIQLAPFPVSQTRVSRLGRRKPKGFLPLCVVVAAGSVETPTVISASSHPDAMGLQHI